VGCVLVKLLRFSAADSAACRRISRWASPEVVNGAIRLDGLPGCGGNSGQDGGTGSGKGLG
jgi:hypothetical protein